MQALLLPRAVGRREFPRLQAGGGAQSSISRSCRAAYTVGANPFQIGGLPGLYRSLMELFITPTTAH